MKQFFLIAGLFFLIIISGCKKDNDYIIYHKFENHSWYRYNTLQFEIPVLPSPKGWDIYFFVTHANSYSFDNLDFNMIMTTPSGEERIKEYHFEIKKQGSFTGNCTSDSCTVSIALKKEIYLPPSGVIKISIEPIVPRLEIGGLFGVGIRMHPRG
ncbi:MAG: hypothetical protein NTX61_06065 [Bacteroidetes bacterium]|nr:hypothetical protein [Bacteroidota bacterium]